MNLEILSQELKIDPSGTIPLPSGAAKAMIIASMFKRSKVPMLVISRDAAMLADDLKAFSGNDKVAYFPSWDTFPTEDISPSKEIIGQRLDLLCRIINGENMILVTGVRAAMTWIMPMEVLKKHSISIKNGARLSREELIVSLIRTGYKRRDIVGEKGEFSARGGIIDIFASHMDNPVRTEFLGDRVESIRGFDTSDQRSLSKLQEVTILPVHELILPDGEEYVDGIEARIPEIYPEFSSITDLFCDRCVLLDDPQNIMLSAKKFIKEVKELRGGIKGKHYLDPDDLQGKLTACRTINGVPAGESGISDFHQQEQFYGKLDELSERLKEERTDFMNIIISKQTDRIYDLLIEKGLAPQKVEYISNAGINGIYIMYGELTRGFGWKNINLFTDSDIFGVLKEKNRSQPKGKEGISDALLTKLEYGDYVVHTNHGIGKYKGLEKLEIGGALQEYIEIDYANEDKLYVPLHQMGMVEKYTGGGDVVPKLDRLGGTRWMKTRSNAKKAIKDLTAELLDIYSSRQKEEGYQYPPDTVWQMELERSFPFEETPDQAKAIREIKKEMELGKLMDRLVCGDVGYGKTEVALRAAFKTAQAGRQVAFLAPTTILVDQHFHTLSERFASYPISVDMLSRFRSREEQERTVKAIEDGTVDIVVGTHRLLSKDIKFRTLGLLVIDEEQKFGVEHKEKIKKLAKGVNVITLSATPIPRTLYMALSGVREMSVISTPPLDRSPVRTYLRPWDETLIKEAVLREMERDGQVFIVHNVVKTIYGFSDNIKKMVPDARVAVAHGQMDEQELEDVMLKFIKKEYDVLVTTSIIESGLDIPTVNTVIIDHAENFGLSQLYQIRGRVGRSSTRAFAYLLYHKENVLTDQALERLKAIQEFTALGSGYRLAMADLEIRGAGNLLGAAQHGHLLNIGFEMYCDLLEESVRELKHVQTPVSKKVMIDLKINAFIPKDYVEDDKQRIALYRRMNILNSYEDLDDFQKEMVDRFGPIPKELEALFSIIKVKINAASKGITSITGGATAVEIRFEKRSLMVLKTKNLGPTGWFKHVADTVKKLPSLRAA